MSNASGPKITNIKINPDNLYKEESFTDLTYATIRRLTPVKIDGSIDENREPVFAGMAQLMSPNGPIPVQCVIEGAKTLSEAAAKLPDAIEKSVQAMIAEAEAMQRQESSRIVIPGQ
ncbi:MAG: cytoplasmic protein [Syntrophaceae bacterium]|nr:MAG: cytoplasmic protein [Syntrophaceae bacterium]